jgi:alpha-L-fucosidase
MTPINRRQFVAAASALPLLPRFHFRRHADIPRPSPAQLLWQQDELAMFIHFGINTFTDREWGDGREEPELFNPTALDARQWARTARRAGFKAMVLTAKHHDGFCLWPTATTRHSVASSPWRGGNGDVVGEFVAACRAENLRVGLYLSPWDQNSPVYGDSPRYDEFYTTQLTELLTRYGPIHEVWFDGANGEGPNGKRQVYDWPRYWSLVKKLQPDSVIFSDAGPDVRWIGNERGVAGETNWSTVDPAIVPVPGMTGDEVMRSLTEGDRDGSVWRPGETDTSIRPGWFWHADQDDKVRSVNDLVDLYFTSVGRNSKLLLNVPPTRAGVLHDVDVARLVAMRRRLDEVFGSPVRGRADSSETGAASATFTRRLDAATPLSVIDLREDITQGQRVGRHAVKLLVDGEWRTVAEGTTIGYRRLHRFEPVTARAMRLEISDVRPEPLPVSITGYRPA